MADTPLIVLTIAGFDPSSGAGVTADIKTIAAHGCYGVACVTALTVQSTTGVRRFEPADPGLITETLEEITADIPIAAVHIGMLGTGRAARAVADFLGSRTGKAKLPNIVLDPILKIILRCRPAGRAGDQGADRETHPTRRCDHSERRRGRRSNGNESIESRGNASRCVQTSRHGVTCRSDHRRTSRQGD